MAAAPEARRYAHFRGLCPAALIAEARAAIDADLATNYDAARQIEYDHQSYCPGLRRTPVLMALLFGERDHRTVGCGDRV